MCDWHVYNKLLLTYLLTYVCLCVWLRLTSDYCWHISVSVMCLVWRSLLRQASDHTPTHDSHLMHRTPLPCTTFTLHDIASSLTLCIRETLIRRVSDRVGPGHPSSPLVHLLPHLFPFLLFPFFHWLYLFSSFVQPFRFYQNSPTPFPGRRS